MAISPLAGKPAPQELLVDLTRLEQAYYERRPDLGDRNQLVRFGTSGHRGSPLCGSFTEAHILAITQAICDYQLRKHIGALAAVLGGLDTLVFAGGIGERATPVRWEVCRGLEHLGMHLDPQRNAAHADPITTPHSACVVRIIPTNEDLMIARHTHTLIFPRTTKPPAGESI
jgi:hypothetical protein